MEIVFHLAVFFLGGLCVAETEALTEEGNVGRSINITCSHGNAYSNAKYFCKDPCYNKDVLIHSGGKKNFSKGRYNIVDKGNTFYVTIAELKKTDTGKYWCGIDRVGADTYNEVDLRVVDDHMVFIGAGIGIAVLVLAIILLIFIRHRRRETSLSPDKDSDIVDATSSNQQQDIHYGIITFPSTAKENLETENRTNPIHASSVIQLQDTSRGRTDNIYSDVITSPSL
ncbi:uncharacterized protein ACJ7VT_018939 isoform 2-T2 [Polymixia lowei]